MGRHMAAKRRVPASADPIVCAGGDPWLKITLTQCARAAPNKKDTHLQAHMFKDGTTGQDLRPKLRRAKDQPRGCAGNGAAP
jgi:hypothetical protein